MPRKDDVEAILSFVLAEETMVVFTALKLISKHGMRIEAFRLIIYGGKSMYQKQEQNPQFHV